MNLPLSLSILLLTCANILHVHAWTDEDLELFDLVESTDRKFYDILGVDQKASASEIRKAYRRLSQQYHPDKNKEPNAEETFRKIAAIADVLRNEEQRKKYDIILQTGLPDWREPIYYYRRVRNMGLVELVIFLFCLATLGQYLFAWSAYWEKKYEIEELVLSKIKKRAKHQRKGRYAKSAEEAEAVAAEIDNLPKPRCQDLFPVQLACFLIHFAQSFPLYLRHLFENLKSTWTAKKDEDDDMEETNERRVRYKTKKHVKPQFPELADLGDQEDSKIPNGKGISCKNGGIHTNSTSSHSSEIDVNEFKKALKRYPNGTLQRWEKIAEYLDCPVSEVASLVKQMKSQPFAKSVPISAQGVTGSEDNISCINDMTTTKSEFEEENHLEKNGMNDIPNGTVTHRANSAGDGVSAVGSEKTWKQEEQKLLEVALLKFPKDTPARWDRIADYVKTRTKEECIARYKELAEQIKKKKRKEN